MRANRQQKRNPNPNPPWPTEQSVVVVPPGSGPGAIGKNDSKIRNMPSSTQINVPDNTSNQTYFERSEGMPIMGYAGNSRGELGIPQRMWQESSRTLPEVSDYLNKNLDKYAKVEFLFGENTHIEKNGILRTVGKDFVVLEEAGSQNHVVCSAKNIKFINIYDVK